MGLREFDFTEIQNFEVEDLSLEQDCCFDLTFDPDDRAVRWMRKYSLDTDPSGNSHPNIESVLRDAPCPTSRTWFMASMIAFNKAKAERLFSLLGTPGLVLSEEELSQFDNLPVFYANDEVSPELPRVPDALKNHPVVVRLFG